MPAVTGRLMAIGGIALTEPLKATLNIKQDNIPVGAAGANQAGGTGFDEGLAGLSDATLAVEGNLVRSEVTALIAMIANKTQTSLTFAPANPSGGKTYTLADSFPTDGTFKSPIDKQTQFSGTFRMGGALTENT